MSEAPGLVNGITGGSLAGFSGLVLFYMFKHGSRLENALRDKEKSLQDKTTQLTDTLVTNARLDAEIKQAGISSDKLRERIEKLDERNATLSEKNLILLRLVDELQAKLNKLEATNEQNKTDKT